MKKSKFISIILSAAMVAGIFTGCGANNAQSKSTTVMSGIT